MGLLTLVSLRHGKNHHLKGSAPGKSDASSSNAKIYHLLTVMEVLIHTSQFGTQITKSSKLRPLRITTIPFSMKHWKSTMILTKWKMLLQSF
jgi:hypothetical protein